MDNLLQKLLQYDESNMYPFHMPGHKRNVPGSPLEKMYHIDITEIEGFDNLHCPEGVLKEEQQFAATLYGAEKSYFLINGSTSGILTAISSTVPRGGKLLLARNSHKSAYNALYLREIEAEYVYPYILEEGFLYGSISPNEIRRILQDNYEQRENSCPFQAVMITSPSFDGVISDIRRIAEVVHEFGIPLIVDEAHGAHLGFYSDFPESAVKSGADIVIQSLHKTLPSLTQTAVLHVNGNIVDRQEVEKYLAIYQSSSPSYVLMASMSECLHYIRDNREQLFSVFSSRLADFYKKTGNLSSLRVFGVNHKDKVRIFAFDISKIVISTYHAGISGYDLYRILLEKYQIQVEMASEFYVLALTSIMDTQAGFDRLAAAILEIDKSIAFNSLQKNQKTSIIGMSVLKLFQKSEKTMCITDAADALKIEVLFQDCAGRISGEFLYLYPPGIPVVVPGERISQGILDQFLIWKQIGLNVQGPKDTTLTRIQILEEEVLL